MHTKFWLESQGKRQLGRPRHKWEGFLEKYGGKVGTGFIWLRMGTSDRLL
jgi:hypothetical protein